MRVAVVCGGTSREAEVSRSSGNEVATALRETHPDTRIFELSPEVGDELRDWNAEAVFPVLHGPPGEDGTFQGFLEILGLPYVGSGVRASATAMDKTLAKHVFRHAGLPVAADVLVDRSRDPVLACAEVVEQLGAEVVIKPAREGSAIGVAFATGRDDIHDQLAHRLEDHEQLLVERRVVGREITVGIFDRGDGPHAFPVVEIVTPEGSWYDYEHRYTEGLSEHLIPAPIPPEVADRLQELAIRAHLALGCRDLSRADFVLPDKGDPVLLEVNTLPGMTATSLYPDAAAADGLPFPQLVARLVERAAARRGA